jgi:teichuronic acid biosynthesis glycosyltransferase TuaG
LMYAKSFAETGASILHSSYFTIDECSNIIGYVQSPPVINFSGNLVANRIGNLTGVYSRDVFGKVLQKNIRHEDFNMWLDLLSFHNSVRVEPALSAYRITRNSLSSNKIASVMWHFKVIISRPELPWWKKIVVVCSRLIILSFAMSARFLSEFLVARKD